MSSEDIDDKWLKKLDRQTQQLIDRVGEDRKTASKVFDKSTLLLLGKLISDGVFETIDFPISTGKEAFVFRAITENNSFVAVKVYRTATLPFKQLGQYIIGDPRFSGITRNRRELVFEWAKKEYKNLQRLQKTSVKVPKPIKYLKNIVVMQYIGTKQHPAPLLKDVVLSDPASVYEQLVGYMISMFQQAQLIHADFSSYNILFYRKQPVIIDLGQGVLKSHPQANQFLLRDIHNICQYFKKYGVSTDEQKVYSQIVKESSLV